MGSRCCCPVCGFMLRMAQGSCGSDTGSSALELKVAACQFVSTAFAEQALGSVSDSKLEGSLSGDPLSGLCCGPRFVCFLDIVAQGS